MRIINKKQFLFFLQPPQACPHKQNEDKNKDRTIQDIHPKNQLCKTLMSNKLKTNPIYFRDIVSESSPSPRKKKSQLNCSDSRVITKNRENVCMQTTQIICQAHLCREQKTITLQELDQLRKGHKPTNSWKKKKKKKKNQFLSQSKVNFLLKVDFNKWRLD